MDVFQFKFVIYLANVLKLWHESISPFGFRNMLNEWRRAHSTTNDAESNDQSAPVKYIINSGFKHIVQFGFWNIQNKGL